MGWGYFPWKGRAWEKLTVALKIRRGTEGIVKNCFSMNEVKQKKTQRFKVTIRKGFEEKTLN